MNIIRKILNGVYSMENVSNAFPIAILLILTVISRIPLTYQISKINDVGWDGAYYSNLSSNLASGKGYKTDFKVYFINKIDTLPEYKTQISRTTPMISPAYPFLGAIFMKFSGENPFSLVILNLTLFLISSILFYAIILRLTNKLIAFWFSCVFILQPMVFSYSQNILSEYTYLFFLIFSILVGLKYIKAKKQLIWLILLSISFSMIFLSKHIGIFHAFSVMIFLMIRRNYKHMLLFIFITAIFWSGWEIFYSLLHYDNLILSKYFISANINFPDGISGGHGLSFIDLLKIKFISGFSRLGAALGFLSTYEFLYLFLPFPFIVMFINRKDQNIQFLSLQFIILLCIPFLSTVAARRYFIGMVPLGLILTSVFFNAEYFRKNYLLNAKTILFIILPIILYVYMYADLRYMKNVKEQIPQIMAKENAYLKIKPDPSVQRIATNNPPATSHYLERESIMLSPNLSRESFPRFLDQYQLDAIVIHNPSFNIGHYKKNCYVLELFSTDQDSIVLNDIYIQRIYSDQDISYYKINHQ